MEYPDYEKMKVECKFYKFLSMIDLSDMQIF